MSLVCTVDVEDWAQSTLDPEMPISSRAGPNLERVLDILAEEGVKATCFVLGKFAEKFPACIRRIAAEGHEVASHGYGHVDVFRMSPAQFRADVRRSKAQLEALTGKPVQGYRAPDFSIVKASLWALAVLAEEGFTYDASINPAVLARFGIPDFPAQPVRLRLSGGGTLMELPVATLRLLGRHLPVAGGGYHRLLPFPAIRWAIEKTVLADQVFIAYCHPYEFDPDEFRHLRPPVSWKIRLHQGLGRRGFERKFRRMLREFETTLAFEVAARPDWPEQGWPDMDAFLRASWRIPKRLFDFSAALAGLVGLAPVMLVVAILVRATSPGPALFVQPRVGRGGRLFRCVKFRTMRLGAEAQGSVTTATDSRVTAIGRWLRRWKLDELPQLWNVLTGRMSLVGPRPDVPGYADRLQGADRCILDLRPGITGPATLLFREEERLLARVRHPQAFNDAVVFPEKVRLNREYLETGSFGRDLGYVLATLWPALAKRMGWDVRLGLNDAEFSARMEAAAMRY